MSLNLPFRSRVQLHGHHLNAIPRSYADTTEQALQGNDCWLAGAQKQEEGTACWDEHGATWGDDKIVIIN